MSGPVLVTGAAGKTGLAVTRALASRGDGPGTQYVMRVQTRITYCVPFHALMKMFDYYGEHGLAGGTGVLSWLLGRPPTTLAEFVHHQIRDEPS